MKLIVSLELDEPTLELALQSLTAELGATFFDTWNLLEVWSDDGRKYADDLVHAASEAVKEEARKNQLALFS